jgi:hypothetical protein
VLSWNAIQVAAASLGVVMGLVVSFGIAVGIRGLLENAAKGDDANNRNYYIYGSILAGQLLVPVGLMLWKKDLVRAEPLMLVVGLMGGLLLGLVGAQGMRR